MRCVSYGCVFTEVFLGDLHLVCAYVVIDLREELGRQVLAFVDAAIVLQELSL